MLKRLKKGLRDPSKIPPYLFRRYVNPDSEWGTNRQRLSLDETTVYTWNDDFDWGHSSPPDTSANNYYAYESLKYYLDSEYNRGFELGCGWGNITSWISEFADETHGLDPNKNALLKSREHYPHIDVTRGIGSSIPFKSDNFDLIITNTVLMHIPPTEIESTADELTRILSDNGTLLINEDFDVSKGSKDGFYPRKKEEYRNIFADLSVSKTPAPERDQMIDFVKFKK